MKRKQTAIVLSVAAALFICGCLLHYARGTYYYGKEFQHVSGTDDAYISYRYGWNLLHYGILSWNESGFRRTEGFTNPLWVYLSAAWSLLGDKDWIYPGMVITSLVVMIALLFTESLLVLRNANSPKGLMGIFLLCASPVIWLHTTSGLESGIFGAGSGLLAYYAISSDKPNRLGIWLANVLALFLTVLRSDGFVYLLILLTGLILSRNGNLKMIGYGGAIGILALYGWREYNFGQLFPNTAIAKLNFGADARLLTGIDTFLHSLISGGVIFLLAGIFGILSAPKSIQIAACTTLAGWIAYYIYIGGDLYLERHLIGVMVLAAGLSQGFFSHVLQDKRGWALASVLLIGVYAPLYTGDPRFGYLQGKPEDPWIRMGKEIALQRKSYGTIVTFPAGKIPFYAGGNFIDELGLNDPDLSKVKRPRFIPGHSAGSHEIAIELAKQSSQTYGYIVFGLDLTPENAKDVLLWISNYSPENGVQHELTDMQRDTILRADPFAYTLLFRGK